MALNFDDPKTIGLLTLASGLLANSGWSTQKRGLGEIFGQSGMQSIQAMQQAKRQQLEMEEAEQMRAYRETQMSKINQDMLREQQGQQQMGQWQGLVGGLNSQDLTAYGGGMTSPMTPQRPSMEQNLLGPFAPQEPVPFQQQPDGRFAGTEKPTEVIARQPWDVLNAQADLLEEKSNFITDPTVQQRSQMFVKSLRDRADRLQGIAEKKATPRNVQFEEIPTGRSVNGKPEYQKFQVVGTNPDGTAKMVPIGKPATKGALVDINTSQEKEEAKIVGKGYGELYLKVQESARGSARKADRVDRMNQLLEGVQTGKLTPLGTDIASYAQSLGISIDPKLGNKQAAEALANEFALELRNPSGGAGMPGAMSDPDREFLRSMSPGLEKTPEGRRLLAETIKAVAKRDQDVARIARDYRKKHGQLDEGFEDALAEFSSKNPLFEKGAAEVRSSNREATPAGKPLEFDSRPNPTDFDVGDVMSGPDGTYTLKIINGKKQWVK